MIDWQALLEDFNSTRSPEDQYSLDRLQEIAEPVKIGPTWQSDDEGYFLVPKLTLGWTIAEWCSDWLYAPPDSPDIELGTPWAFTDEQLRWLLWWYAIDESGKFIYRKGVLQRCKGWGKDPLLALVSIVEFVGPCRFAGFSYETGEPLCKQQEMAEVQIAATSLEQTKNTMDMIKAIMSPDLIAKHGIRIGADLVRAHHGTHKIKAVTSNWRALEGKRATFVVLNETHHWVSGNGGHEMYNVIEGNKTKGAKRGSRYLAITNAYLPGEDSVAERMRLSWEKVADGMSVDTGTMYDSLEAHEMVPLHGDILAYVLGRVCGDATWLSIEDTIASILDPDNSPARSRRMYLNQVVASDESLHTPGGWAALSDTEAKPILPGDTIVLGFDGSKTRDSTALLAIRVSDSYVELLDLWERPEANDWWQVPRDEVDARVRECFEAYNVVAFYADVAYWEAYLDLWAKDFGAKVQTRASARHPFAFDMRSMKAATSAHESLLSAVRDGLLKHGGDGPAGSLGKRLRVHVLNAVRRENVWGVYFGKESKDSPRKVDAYAALLLAYKALTDFRLKAKPSEKPRSSRGFWL